MDEEAGLGVEAALGLGVEDETLNAGLGTDLLVGLMELLLSRSLRWLL